MSSFPAAEADCLFKPTAIYSPPLCLERKSTNFFRVKLKFLWPEPAEPSPLANALCNHFELHSSSLVQTHTSLHSCGWAHSQWCCHQSFHAASFPWLLGVCSLSALHHHCTVHNNYFGSSFQFELFLPFVRGLKTIFHFQLKGFVYNIKFWMKIL